MEMVAKRISSMPITKLTPKRHFWFPHFRACTDPTQLLSLYFTTYDPKDYDTGIAGGIRPEEEDAMRTVPKPVEQMRDILSQASKEYGSFRVSKTHLHATLIRTILDEKHNTTSSPKETNNAEVSVCSADVPASSDMAERLGVSSFVFDAPKIMEHIDAMTKSVPLEVQTVSEAEKMFNSFWDTTIEQDDMSSEPAVEEHNINPYRLVDPDAPEYLAAHGIWLINTKTIQPTDKDEIPIDWIPFWTMVVVRLYQQDPACIVSKTSSQETFELAKACETFVSSALRWESVRSLFDTPEKRLHRQSMLELELDAKMRDASTAKEKKQVERERE
ncbi:MAG: hypothetical protein VXY56_10040, partial [Pseudomonadota bacterium]|nr:hypothetical protein [Pseudomonadota bacterium]